MLETNPYSMCTGCGQKYYGWAISNSCGECGATLKQYTPTQEEIAESNRRAVELVEMELKKR